MTPIVVYGRRGSRRRGSNSLENKLLIRRWLMNGAYKPIRMWREPRTYQWFGHPNGEPRETREIGCLTVHLALRLLALDHCDHFRVILTPLCTTGILETQALDRHNERTVRSGRRSSILYRKARAVPALAMCKRQSRWLTNV